MNTPMNNMMSKLLTLLLALCSTTCATGTQASEDERAAVEWVRTHAIRLETVRAGHGFSDMRPLREIVGDARIVALGEATHGTREFFQLKHRMLEFLATEMGFTHFAIEANLPEAYRVNKFVLTGEGDPRELLRGMYFWTWNTEEVLDMILWMREFNRSGKGRLEFTGFDMQTPDVAMEVVRDFVAKADSSYSADLDAAYAPVKSAVRSAKGASFGVATAKFPIEDAAGKKVRYRGFIRSQGVTHGWAGLWWRVDGDSGVLAFDNMETRGVKGTTPWTRYEIELDVPRNGTNINFGVLHTGDGTAWFDGLEVELDGTTYANKGPADLGFESATVRGFYTGGFGYQVEIAKVGAFQGRQCLVIRHAAEADTTSKESEVAIDDVSRKCLGVVNHLETSRDKLGRDGSIAKEVEWAIQNARVVHQCVQSAAGEKSRDESMAENVKWILDQGGPKARIALWAHNGHVVDSGFRGYEPMGRYLRTEYGDDMVVFGFAFNRGSFRAVEKGRGLRAFSVGPAAAGTFDRALSSVRLPILAVDLRQVPVTGQAADWLRAQQRSRNIGAMYSEADPDQFYSAARMPEVFDALFFVEKTTASRGNPGKKR